MDNLERKIFTLLGTVKAPELLLSNPDDRAEYDEDVAKIIAKLIREKFIPKE